MIDTHCHLNYIDKQGTPEQLVNEARKAGVETIINIGADLESSEISVKLARECKSVYATVGVHPHDAKHVDENMLGKLKELCQSKKVVAVGEIGLDFYRNISPPQIQKSIFRKQLKLAIESDLPIVIHSRDAHEDVIKIIKDCQSDLKGGVFHCFQGNYDAAMEVIEMGFVISVGGVITYKNSEMAETARQVPLDKIILETDAPYLTPVPFRGQTNKPEYVKYVYQKLAELKSLPLKDIEKTVDTTARKLFGLVETFGD